MDTPPPAADPSPKVEKSSSLAGKLRTIVTVFAIVVFALIFFGRKVMMGTKYKVSDNETIGYSEKATEEDAKKLAEILKADGIFTGTKTVDVLLKRHDKEGLVISFIPTGSAHDPKVVEVFNAIGEDIAAKGFGKPLTIRLMDERLNKQNDIVIK